MRLPSSYGSVYKMKGRLRNPYRVIVTLDFYLDKDTGRAKQKRKTIGYYASRKEGLEALEEYHRNPTGITSANKITFKEVYEKWSESHFEKVKPSTVRSYKAAFKICASIEHRTMQSLTLDDFQKVVDESGKNQPTLENLKKLLSAMCDYAILHDIWTEDKKRKVAAVDISKAKYEHTKEHRRFTPEEVEKVWNNKDQYYCDIVLMYLYTGCRKDELLDLKKENVNLEEHWFDIVNAKTKAGVRKVPIADKIYPFFEHWYNLNDSEYLLSNSKGKRISRSCFYERYWYPTMQNLEMEHRTHDTRYTTISLLTEAGVPDVYIKKIVGHSGDLTQNVYTQISNDVLLEQINKI